ncbi:hypothetical protein GP486_002807 [Trichoglossum hirsutum]|uniref:Uncharacterized protein n=1 Tax=Trichoglossum hirsutum TaxID=265104 RepID=A0A9P8LEC0_9PEZI|nr:hypothetical protein GP486_002807 [Trichoglossum hirsutum]
MDGSETAIPKGGSQDRPGRVYPHFEDLVAMANPQLDIHTPIRKVLIEVEKCLKKADLNLELHRPDIAYVEYLTACNFVVYFIPRHKEYPTLAGDRGELWRMNKDLQKVCYCSLEACRALQDTLNTAFSSFTSREPHVELVAFFLNSEKMVAYTDSYSD